MSQIGQQCRQANESGNWLSDVICGTASHKMDTQDTGQWSSGRVKAMRPHMHELHPLDLRKWLVHSQKTLSHAAAISQNKHLIRAAS
jgi:hypothetical protein